MQVLCVVCPVGCAACNTDTQACYKSAHCNDSPCAHHLCEPQSAMLQQHYCCNRINTTNACHLKASSTGMLLLCSSVAPLCILGEQGAGKLHWADLHGFGVQVRPRRHVGGRSLRSAEETLTLTVVWLMHRMLPLCPTCSLCGCLESCLPFVNKSYHSEDDRVENTGGGSRSQRHAGPQTVYQLDTSLFYSECSPLHHKRTCMFNKVVSR